MNYEKFNKDWNKPTIITAQQYGVKVSVELDHSDTDIDELFDAFQTLVVGLGYHESAWKGWIVERAAEYQEEENDKLEDETIYHDKVKQSVKDAIARYNKDSEGYENVDELENDFFGSYDYEAEKRMDIIGQNGNDGLHYDEDYEGQFKDWNNETPDEDEFDDYGQRITSNKVLIDAKKQYDEQINNSKIKSKSKKRNNKD